MSTRCKSGGFTMLEVLISIVIIAFGLLGVAGLQAFALKNNNSASLRTTATILAADMMERMRANHLGHAGYNATSLGDYENPVATCLTPSGACSPAQLAANDLAEWQDRVGAALPNGVGIVCLDTTPNDGANATAPACDGSGGGLAGGQATWVIKIWWTDNRGAGATLATPQLFWTAFNP